MKTHDTAPSRIDELIADELSAKALRVDGPLLDVELRFDCPEGRACPPVRGKALVDTGADRTAIAFEGPDELGVEHQGFYHAQGVTSEAIALPLYPLKMKILGSNLPEVSIDRAAATPHLSSQGLVALIGRDVLEQMTLRYDGQQGEFSMESIDGGSIAVKPSGVRFGVAALVALTGSALAYFILRPTPTCPPCELRNTVT